MVVNTRDLNAAPIGFNVEGPCGGETTTTNQVATTAHCFTTSLAERGISPQGQIDYLASIGAQFITNPMVILKDKNGNQFVDGAILLSQNLFFPSFLPQNPPGQKGRGVSAWLQLPAGGFLTISSVRYLSPNTSPAYLSASNLTNLNGLTMHARMTGFRNNLANPACYKSRGDSFIGGDSGAAAKYGNTIVGIFYRSNSQTIGFFPTDGTAPINFLIPRGRSLYSCR